MEGRSLYRMKDKSAAYRVRGVHPDHQFVEKTIIVQGRYINESDIKEHRKVCVISVVIKNELFGEAQPHLANGLV